MSSQEYVYHKIDYLFVAEVNLTQIPFFTHLEIPQKTGTVNFVAEGLVEIDGKIDGLWRSITLSEFQLLYPLIDRKRLLENIISLKVPKTPASFISTNVMNRAFDYLTGNNPRDPQSAVRFESSVETSENIYEGHTFHSSGLALGNWEERY